MSDNEMLKCLIAFILGWLASRMMGNGFSVGSFYQCPKCNQWSHYCDGCTKIWGKWRKNCNLPEGLQRDAVCENPHDRGWVYKIIDAKSDSGLAPESE